MIEFTAEMRAAAERRMGVDDLDLWTEAAFEDVLAIVDRDNDVTPKLPPFEHRMTTPDPWWNHYMGEYSVECTCGSVYSGSYIEARDLAMDHIDAQGDAP